MRNGLDTFEMRASRECQRDKGSRMRSLHLNSLWASDDMVLRLDR